MSRATARVRGADKLLKALDRLKEMRPVKQAVLASALMVERTAKESVAHGNPSGRVYERRGVSHQASAPGEPPATDTGGLLSSIRHEVSEDGFSATVGSDLEQAEHLEYGTRNMEPRPFLHPALDINRKAIIDRINLGLKQATEEAAKLAEKVG